MVLPSEIIELAQTLVQTTNSGVCSQADRTGRARLTLWKFSVNVRMGLNCVGDYAFQASDLNH